MQVYQLIELLQQMPQGAEVLMSAADDYCYDRLETAKLENVTFNTTGHIYRDVTESSEQFSCETVGEAVVLKFHEPLSEAPER